MARFISLQQNLFTDAKKCARLCKETQVQETKNAFDNAFLECFCVEACVWNGSKSIQMQEYLCEKLDWNKEVVHGWT